MDREHRTCLPYQHSPTGLLPFLSNPGRADHDTNGNRALRDIEQLRLEHCEAEIRNDQIRKYPEPADNEIGNQNQSDHAPDQWIREGLENLVSLVLLVLYAHLISSDALDKELFLIFGEALCSHGAVRQ